MNGRAIKVDLSSCDLPHLCPSFNAFPPLLECSSALLARILYIAALQTLGLAGVGLIWMA